jgi:F-type H+-transporting ATPase subunit a
MLVLRSLVLAVLLTGGVGQGRAAEGHAPQPDAAAAAHAEHVGPVVTPDAPTLFKIGGLPITNSIVVTWMIALGILVVVRLGTKNLKETPSGVQNFIESAVEGLENLTKGLLEPKVARWVFPLVATYFLFILISNLVGLLPGVGSLGWGKPAAGSPLPLALEHADVPLVRPPTADANMTVAMAAIFFIMSTFWAFRYNGPLGLVKHIFGVKGGMTGWIVVPLSLVFIFIGLIEVISICIRPVALAMRLYGNIYGGESVLTIMLGKGLLGLAAAPFYFLELLVAVVQALVFTLLCIAFIGSLCSHSEDEPHEAH